MEYLIEQFGWANSMGGIVIFLLIVYYFVREREENSRIEGMQSNQVSLEDRTNESGEVTPVFQEKKNVRRVNGGIQTFLSPTSSFSFQKKNFEVSMTRPMIDQLKSLPTAGFIMRTLISKMIPEEMLQILADKALKGELEEGMKVKFENGKLRISPKNSSH